MSFPSSLTGPSIGSYVVFHSLPEFPLVFFRVSLSPFASQLRRLCPLLLCTVSLVLLAF